MISLRFLGPKKGRADNIQAGMTDEFPFLEQVYSPVGQHKIEYDPPLTTEALIYIEI
jgi:hypothetical protein